MLGQLGYVVAVAAVSLLGGTLGFKYLAKQDALTAFENSAMLLGGMGPVGDADKYARAGKWFAAFFALYAGLVFIIIAGLLTAPVFHRIIHRFHWDASKR
jgi:predicted membrane-bound spermidine synthase